MNEPYSQSISKPHTKLISSSYSRLGWVICGLAALFYCYEYLLRISPSVMVTELMQSFQVDKAGFGVLIGLYYLIYTPMQAVVGVSSDLFGPRRILTAAMGICVIGNIMFSMSHSLYIAGAGRLLIGFGSAFAFVCVLKLASVWLPPNRFAMIVEMATALGMIGAMVGNVGLAVLVAHLGWRETLYIATIVGVVLLPVIWLVVKDKPKHHQEVKVKPLSVRETFMGLGCIIKSPQMWIAGLIGCMLYLSLSVFGELWGNKFLQTTFGFSTITMATANDMVFLGWLIGAPLCGLISDRMGRRRLPLTVGSILAAITVTILLYAPHLSTVAVYILLLLFGIFCSAQVICFAVGRENAPTHVAGTAVSFINMLVMVGGMLFQPLVGKLLDIGWTNVTAGVRVFSAHDFRMALMLLPIGLVISAILTIFLRETHAKVVHNEG